MANNKAIWIGLASAVIIGGGIYLWYKSKKDKEAEEVSSDESDTEKQGTETTQPTTTPKKGKVSKGVSKGAYYRGFNKGSLVYLKTDRSSIYSSPEFKGENIISDVSKSLLSGRPFAKFLDKADNKFIKVETIMFVRKCPPNARCITSLIPIKEIAYIPEGFVSNKA